MSGPNARGARLAPEPAAGPATAGPDTTPSGFARQIARNTVVNLGGRLFYLAGWAVVAPLMLARLGPDRFGLWALLSVVSGLYLSVDFGLSGALTRFVAEFRATGDTRALRGTSTLAALMYAAITLAFAIALVALRGPLLDLMRVPAGLRPEAERAWLAAVMAGIHRLDVWNGISAGVTLLQLGAIAAALVLGRGLVALMLASGASYAVGTIVGWIVIRRLAPDVGFGALPAPPGLFRRLARFGGALQVINLAVLAQLQLEKILFGVFLSLGAVGQYEFGFRLALGLWAIPQVMIPPLLPASAHLDATGDLERLRRLYRRASRYLLAIAFPLAAGIVALAPAAFVAWLGPGHRDAALCAAGLSVMMGVVAVTWAGSIFVRGMGRPGVEARYQVVAVATHVALALVLVPRFGVAGGMLALSVSGLVGALVFIVSFHRLFREPLGRFAREVFAGPALAALAGGIAAALAGGAFDPGLAAWSRGEAIARLALGMGAGLAVTLATLALTRALRVDEIRELASLALTRGRPAS
jgi:O-antigen/teichoic acid export membrane protein